jgi:hypothetical protein
VDFYHNIYMGWYGKRKVFMVVMFMYSQQVTTFRESRMAGETVSGLAAGRTPEPSCRQTPGTQVSVFGSVHPGKLGVEIVEFE